MLDKVKNRKEEGFTIIEVLIVLAIAGLIILIVLLAVPNLQRNSRNTSMKNDVAAIAGGLSEFAANNDGASPDVAGSSKTAGSPDVTLNNSTIAGAAKTVAKVQGGDTVNFGNTVGAHTGVAGQIDIVFGYGCSNATTASNPGPAPTLTIVAADKSSRTNAIIYVNETKAGLQIKCTES